jgi:hypothetical protein
MKENSMPKAQIRFTNIMLKNREVSIWFFAGSQRGRGITYVSPNLQMQNVNARAAGVFGSEMEIRNLFCTA